MSLVSLKTELRQELKLTPQLLQSMEVLQMNVQDLAEYLSRASEENPLLEAESPASLQNAYAQLRRAASWTPGPRAAPFSTRTGPYRSRAPRTGKRRASPPSCGISWSGGTWKNPYWRCVHTWQSWWMRAGILRRRIWRVWRS